MLGREHFKFKNIYTIIVTKYWKIELDTRAIRCPIQMTETNEAIFPLTHLIISYIKIYS